MIFKIFALNIFLSLIYIGSGFRINKINSRSYISCKANMAEIQHSNSKDSIIFKSLGEQNVLGEGGDLDPESLKMKREYNLQVGKCMEVIRRELPLVFYASNIDFSIFSPQIIVSDGNSNRMAMQKSLYTTVVKSLKLATTFSSMYPSMNLKKIEYIEDCSTIQCLVDIVLPDSIRIDGSAVWEGMFYFGLDSHGLISSHTFDRKISNKTPINHINTKTFPWLRSNPQWSPDLLVGAAAVVPDSDQDV